MARINRSNRADAAKTRAFGKERHRNRYGVSLVDFWAAGGLFLPSHLTSTASLHLRRLMPHMIASIDPMDSACTRSSSVAVLRVIGGESCSIDRPSVC